MKNKILKLAKRLETFRLEDVEVIMGEGIEDVFSSVMSDPRTQKYVDSQRMEMISHELRQRIDRLAQIIQSQTPVNEMDMNDNDVDEDEAESYGMEMT